MGEDCQERLMVDASGRRIHVSGEILAQQVQIRAEQRLHEIDSTHFRFIGSFYFFFLKLKQPTCETVKITKEDTDDSAANVQFIYTQYYIGTTKEKSFSW